MMVPRPIALLTLYALVPAALAAQRETEVNNVDASGAFAPNGPPAVAPVRVDAGQGCVIDLTQAYTVTGTLSGTFAIDYRILSAGPCGSPAGTFDEEWIAHGTFTGTLNGAAVSGGLSYTATVTAGGDVEGTIILGPELEGELEVFGNFGDGTLTYEGWVSPG